uniref:Large ribosomal subunit protein bL35c n=1 Tax=Hommersandiophycus borowitzkae TaxID=268573 RepID=A0A1G4NU29_9FLOR|nr:Ribosomal protein L35 [Hommersandiophycus borowitzkae]SCW22182.1 Ribosomal protein L35 [Hommersandiophycus borowitzkae]
MPKLKTSSSVTKRFKMTGTKKVLRRHASKSHLLEKKTQSRKKKLSKVVQVYSGDLKGILQKYFS